MAFSVTYSFNNGATTGTAESIRAFYNALTKFGGTNLTQCTLSGTAQELVYHTVLNLKVGLFQNCRSLISVDLSNLDTSNVTSMYNMFNGCSSLTNLNLSNLDTSSVTSMENMFSGCSSLTTLDLSSFDTSSVTDISCMFTDCSRLEHIYVGDNWTIDNLNISALGYLSVFSGCTSLPNFNSSSVGGYKAYVGEGGYLEVKEYSYSIQLKHANGNAYPVVAVDGNTIIDNNGVISARQYTLPNATTSALGGVKIDSTGGIQVSSGSISLKNATTSQIGGVKVDGTTITANNGVISAITQTPIVTLTQAEYDALATKNPNVLYFIKED